MYNNNNDPLYSIAFYYKGVQSGFIRIPLERGGRVSVKGDIAAGVPRLVLSHIEKGHFLAEIVETTDKSPDIADFVSEDGKSTFQLPVVSIRILGNGFVKLDAKGQGYLSFHQYESTHNLISDRSFNKDAKYVVKVEEVPF